MFNDKYCFSTDIGLKEFDLRIAEGKEVTYAESRS